MKPVSIDGQICDAQLENCRDASSDPDFNRDLQAHFTPFKSHLDLLKAYPIIRFGLGYSFVFRTIRKQ